MLKQRKIYKSAQLLRTIWDLKQQHKPVGAYCRLYPDVHTREVHILGKFQIAP